MQFIINLGKRIQALLLNFNLFILLERFGKLDQKNLIKFLKDNSPSKTNFDLIRIGSDLDGGYLIPDDLIGIKYCFSPGVSNNSDFEIDLNKRYGINSYLADFSVNAPPADFPFLIFKKKFISSSNDEKNLTLDKWLKEFETDNEMILQMDIEGSEYDVLIETEIDVLKKFRILIIEFHNFHYLYTEYGFKMINSIFKKLSKAFHIVHIHPNNCTDSIKNNSIEIPPVIEYTFHRIDRVKSASKNINFPHPLDHNKDFILPKCFYSDI